MRASPADRRRACSRLERRRDRRALRQALSSHRQALATSRPVAGGRPYRVLAGSARRPKLVHALPERVDCSSRQPRGPLYGAVLGGPLSQPGTARRGGTADLYELRRPEPHPGGDIRRSPSAVCGLCSGLGSVVSSGSSPCATTGALTWRLPKRRARLVVRRQE